MPTRLLAAGVLPEEAQDSLRESLWDNISAITASNVFSAVIAAVVCLAVIKILDKVMSRALGRSKLDAPSRSCCATCSRVCWGRWRPSSCWAA